MAFRFYPMPLHPSSQMGLSSAVSEERINRIKLWNGIPRASIGKVLDLTRLSINEIDLFAANDAVPQHPDSRPFEAREAEIRRSDLSPNQREAQIEHLRTRLDHDRIAQSKIFSLKA